MLGSSQVSKHKRIKTFKALLGSVVYEVLYGLGPSIASGALNAAPSSSSVSRTRVSSHRLGCIAVPKLRNMEAANPGQR